ncbi:MULTISPECIES: amidase [Nocardioides]|nr:MULTISPECIES: amidase [unclassified Nocardioides]
MELHHLTATAAKDLFVTRELSPVELLDAVVARTEKVGGAVNALTEQMLDEAYDAAREAEIRYAGSGPAPRALEGIPLLLKEEQAIAGRTLENGSFLMKGQVSPYTHPVVERVQAAGAVVHGRTTTPEFSIMTVTHSEMWGVTRSPFNLDATSGGSSGGAGAALGAGLTTLATGSDIGGSIRIPAAQCGVVGFKPPAGRVPGLPPFNYDAYCSDGPLGRSVADVALLQDVLAGPHFMDPASLRPAYRLPDQLGDVSGMKVALCLNLGDYPVDDVIAANTRAAADALRAVGVTVDEVELPWSRAQVLEVAWAHMSLAMGSFVNTLPPEALAVLNPYTREFIENAKVPRDYTTGLYGEVEFYLPLSAILQEYDALLAPTVGAAMIAADTPSIDTPIPVNGEDFGMYDVMLTMPFNINGRCPVLNVPSGIGPAGVPSGVQIVGRTFDDATVFHLGAALEKSLGVTTADDWWPTL